MDAAGVKESFKNLKERLPEPLSTFEITMNILITLGIGAVTVLLVFYYWTWRYRGTQVLSKLVSGSSKPRFRKRDKVMFYGRKMLRRVHSFARNSISTTSRRGAKKKKLVYNIAKKILSLKKDKEPQMRVREPPASLLEVDRPEFEPSETRLPAEVMYMLRSVRVLGHFEKPIFLELCRFMESRFVPQGAYLFKVGDPDDSIFVVQSGCVHVCIADQDGVEHVVKVVDKGESIHSLLSIMDVLTGHTAKYKTVSAYAVRDAAILRLPVKAFQIVLERFPESMVRIVQIIMVRLQRVTFMALHNYLGLGQELMNPESQSDKTFSVHTIGLSPQGSPIKIKQAPFSDDKSSPAPQPGTQDDEPATQDGSRLELNELKKRAIPVPRRLGDSGRSARGSNTDTEAVTDFDVAMSRARAGVIEDPFISGSPPVKSGDEMVLPGGTPSRRSNKRAVVTDSVQIIPSQPEQSSSVDSLNDDDMQRLAMEDISRLLCLESTELLEGKCYIRHIRHGITLLKQGDQDANLLFVVTGELRVKQQVVGHESEERTLFVVRPGELVGSLAVLTGEPSFFTIKAHRDSRVVVISKTNFYSLMKQQPKVVLGVGHTVVRRLSAFVRQIDFALDWMLIEAGRALFRQGENSDCLYIILNGRLRSVVTQRSGKKELVGEYGRGELVGVVEVLTQSERATTIMAVRDTELAQIPDELLNLIKRIYPQIVTRLIHLLGQRLLGSIQNRPSFQSSLMEHPNVDPRPAVANLATVAVLAVSDDVPLSNFTLELQHALQAIGATLRLTSEIIQNRLGANALDSMNEYRLSGWLGQQEDIHRMVLYQCDTTMTQWTKRCITQADCILIVALADAEPSVGQIEKQMENLAVRAQKELILLHTDSTERPRRTTEWLNMREWCSSHHHIRCPKRVLSRRSPAKMMDIYRKVFETTPDRLSDFSRVARFLTGTAIGLVLGGGGARGIAHVGIIKAMTEVGIPIDMVGGTSIGSMMGAIWADELNLTRFTQRAREFSFGMSSLWKKIFDLTYPATAMFSGSSFNTEIETVFRDRQIEDLWIPYFCITTDITASKMRVHTQGSLWRYVRASMSLSGYLPPLCDPIDGHLLLDGGYVNNLPADIMKSAGSQNIFAVDVGSQDQYDFTNYGDTLSGWWLLWKRWNPWAKTIRVPNMAEIQSRLAYVGCVQQLDQVKNSDYCEYIRPPIDKYATLQFGSFDEIFEVGYNHGKTLFSMWDKRGLVKELFVENSHERVKPNVHKSQVPAEAKFTDLAELISRIDNRSRSFDFPSFFVESDSADEGADDEERISVTSEPVARIQRPLKHKRAGSEGATPGSTPSDDFQDPLQDLLDEEDEEEEEIEIQQIPPGSPAVN